MRIFTGTQTLFLASSMLTGLTAALLTRVVVAVLTQPRYGRIRALDFEYDRRERLRQGSLVYRWLEPVVDHLVEWNRRSSRLPHLRRSLLLSKEVLPWKAEEYLTVTQLQSVLVALTGASFGWLMSGSWLGAVLIGTTTAFAYQRLILRRVAERGHKRLMTLKQRLPFAIDLMALVMEAGASFSESMAAVVRENQDHPLGEELGEVLRETLLGRPRSEALTDLRQRLLDKDVSEIVYAVNKGEELGTPLAQILRGQAEQMRLKRSQWIEKAVGEAQVNVVFPGTVIMIACLIIIVAPFLLAGLSAS